jgi:hypothetical protein
LGFLFGSLLTKTMPTSSQGAVGMESKIYVSAFPPSYTQRQLRQIFVPFGKVESVQVLRDARGYFVGVVQMSSPDEVEHIFGAQQVFQVEGKHLDIWEPPETENAQN